MASGAGQGAGGGVWLAPRADGGGRPLRPHVEPPGAHLGLALGLAVQDRPCGPGPHSAQQQAEAPPSRTPWLPWHLVAQKDAWDEDVSAPPTASPAASPAPSHTSRPTTPPPVLATAAAAQPAAAAVLPATASSASLDSRHPSFAFGALAGTPSATPLPGTTLQVGPPHFPSPAGAAAAAASGPGAAPGTTAATAAALRASGSGAPLSPLAEEEGPAAGRDAASPFGAARPAGEEEVGAGGGSSAFASADHQGQQQWWWQPPAGRKATAAAGIQQRKSEAGGSGSNGAAPAHARVAALASPSRQQHLQQHQAPLPPVPGGLGPSGASASSTSHLRGILPSGEALSGAGPSGRAYGGAQAPLGLSSQMESGMPETPGGMTPEISRHPTPRRHRAAHDRRGLCVHGWRARAHGVQVVARQGRPATAARRERNGEGGYPGGGPLLTFSFLLCFAVRMVWVAQGRGRRAPLPLCARRDRRRGRQRRHGGRGGGGGGRG